MSSSSHRLGIAARGSYAQNLLEPMLVLDGVVALACSRHDFAAVEGPFLHGSNQAEPIAATFCDNPVSHRHDRIDLIAIFSLQPTQYEPAGNLLQADRHLFN